MHRLTHRTNMFHPNRQVKAKGQIGIQPCWKVWLSLKLTLSVTHLLWTMTINRGDFVSLFLHPGHVTSRLHIHLYTVYNVKRPVNLTPLFGLVVEAKGTAGNPCRDMEGMKTPHKESTVDQKGMLIFFFCCAETVLTTALQCHRKDKRKIMAQDTFRREKNLFCLKLTQMCGLRSPKLKPEPGAIRKCFLGDKQFYSDWHRSKII